MASSEKNLWEKSATEVVSLLRSKEISPDEALDENLKRIKETHSSINAVVTICEERARQSNKKFRYREKRSARLSLWFAYSNQRFN